MKTLTVGTYEAKTNLTTLLGRVAKGAEVIITRHERPIARLSAMKPVAGANRAAALRRIDVIAAQTRPGSDSAKDLIVAGRRR
ncbi:MAG: type II toxin-antitoxin system prevent-host-death family antitoxin [Opitutaceae bacterium]|nr:type II toxin-antitoxin system prevent-host-death family antitoxin [Opitutaceae bacterium]